MERLVYAQLSGSIGTITLNRPDRHNSLTPQVLHDFRAALAELREAPDLRAVVLQANGRTFSTGGDVGAFYDHRDEMLPYAQEVVGTLNQVVLEMLDFPVPIIAAVHGIVTGGSLGFILASDIVLVAPRVTFQPYYCVVGFSPDGGWATLLAQVIGHKRTAEVITRNLPITADQAVEWGLANRIHPREEVQAEALKIAEEIAAMRPESIRHHKQVLRRHFADAEGALELELQHFLQAVVSAETRAGMESFLSGLKKG